MTTRSFDPSVYLVTDRALCTRHGLHETVRRAATGGATMVQLRDSETPRRELVDIARALKALLAPRDIPLLINDFVDVAAAAEADGVHLGQGDMRPREARYLLGPNAIIGLSVGNLEELAASREDLPASDYLGTGPFAATGTKDDAGTAIGAEGLEAVRAKVVELPIIAIGGISAANAAQAVLAGADGVAVVSAICAADDPAQAASDIANAVAQARKG